MMQNAHPNQYIAVAKGTTLGGTISGMYSHTTGPRVRPNTMFTINISSIPMVNPGVHSYLFYK